MTPPSPLILHHYPGSPFSEKVRLILGSKNLPWQSVIIPMLSPKPDLVALTGGYRKTPVLQIGADIYCDTALIADVLEHLQPLPTLYPEPCKGLARILAQWADSTLFEAAMAFNLQPKGLEQLFSRRAMSAGMVRPQPQDAAATYKSCLRRLSDMLDDRPFMLGELACISDFSMYHPLWFTRTRTSVLVDLLNATPAVVDWMDRMAALGHGAMEKFSAREAIEVATASTPAPLHGEMFQDEHDIALGSQVQVSAESFGREPTQGELVAATRMHYTLRRLDTRVGTVHVHFPRMGYALKAVAAA